MRYLTLPHLRIITIVFDSFSYHLTIFKQGNIVYTQKYKKIYNYIQHIINILILSYIHIYTYVHTGASGRQTGGRSLPVTDSVTHKLCPEHPLPKHVSSSAQEIGADIFLSRYVLDKESIRLQFQGPSHDAVVLIFCRI